MNLVILTAADQLENNVYLLLDHRLTHINQVLRLNVGDSLRVGLLNGPVGTARIVGLSADKAELECSLDAEIPVIFPTIDVICAVPRPKILRKVLYVSAMMGVRHLYLVRANRTDKSYLASPLLSSEGALPYFLDGLSQGGFTRLPVISTHQQFRPFVEDNLPSIIAKEHLHCFLADSGTDATFKNLISSPVPQNFLIAIGPEGGWVQFEIDLLVKQGFTPVSLGPWTLRVEFALTAALAQVQMSSN